jgi:flagellar biosynthetic protein FliR
MILLDAQEFMTMLKGGFWAFIRIAAAIGIMPVTGTRMLPMRIKLLLSLTITIVILPLLPPPPSIVPLSLEGAVVVLREILTGLVTGFVPLMIFSLFTYAAQLLAMQMGLGFASMVDPQSGVHIPVLGQFYLIFITLLFLSMDGHLVMIELVADSFRILPVAGDGLRPEALWELVVGASLIFSGAVRLALPAMVALLLINIGFGIISRTSPQLNIFAIGFPATIFLGFIAIYLTLGNLSSGVALMLEQGFELAIRLLQP